ncbi:MAG: hypothetical protein S0880_32770 [Actinomycetota bacterium]|nr:hypothetical protein [Actinomycetota bacterium]
MTGPTTSRTSTARPTEAVPRGSAATNGGGASHENEATGTGSSPLPRWLAVAVAVAFGAFIGVPLVATVFGVNPARLENRAPSARPQLTPGALLDDETYGQLTEYLTDRFAFRSLAIRANARLNADVWHSDTGRVRRGVDGWLFLDESLRRLCTERIEPAVAVDALDRMNDAVAGDGERSFHLVIGPAKSTIYPELLGEEADNAGCVLNAVEEMRADLAEHEGEWYVDVYGPVLRLKEELDDESGGVYLDRDTHWTEYGGMAMVAQVLDRVAPGVFDPADVAEVGVQPLEGDLSRILGLPETYEVVDLEVDRKGVSTTELESRAVEGSYPIRRFVSEANTAPLVEGSTLMLFDSYTFPVIEEMAPYFEELTLVHWDAVGAVDVAAMIADADHVIVQVAERNLTFRVGEKLFDADLLDQLLEGP